MTRKDEQAAHSNRSESRRATKIISFRLTPARREELHECAVARGMGVSTLTRELVESMLDGSARMPRRRPQPITDPAELRRVLGHLGKLGSNVNQLTRICHAKGQSPKTEWLKMIHSHVEALRHIAIHALGVADDR
jgi:hypothetical protein